MELSSRISVGLSSIVAEKSDISIFPWKIISYAPHRDDQNNSYLIDGLATVLYQGLNATHFWVWGRICLSLVFSFRIGLDWFVWTVRINTCRTVQFRFLKIFVLVFFFWIFNWKIFSSCINRGAYSTSLTVFRLGESNAFTSPYEGLCNQSGWESDKYYIEIAHKTQLT